jgi:MYXO-CTERM domain-containing protein
MKRWIEMSWAIAGLVGWSCGAPGCNASDPGDGMVADGRITLPPPPAPPVVVRPLAVAAVNTAPVTGASAVAGAAVDTRALVITADGTNAAFGAIQNTLAYLGTPFDVLNASTGPALTEASLSSGPHGKYNAIFLDVGDLGGAFSDAEWAVLTTYEVEFGVRRVALYTAPNASYGLGGSDDGVNPSASPIAATCTAAGKAIFVGTNCANPVQINQGHAYPSAATDASTTPLLVDAAGNVYAATRSYTDGREALVLTFGQASSYVSYLEIAYGLVNWATKGLFVGERHVYAMPQIDDLFLASAIYTGGTYRITDADLQAFADWQQATQANPLTAGFRAAWAVNGAGSAQRPGDPLTAKAVALGPAFAWINHSWDHPVLDTLSYAAVLMEFTQNDQFLRGLGLMPYATINAVTPNISGLGSADAMRAIHDSGIQQIVSDTSVAGENNPSPNAGIWNALEPSVLEIPRKASDLYFNVSQPSEWIPEYEALRGIASIDYPTVNGIVSDDLFSYLLNGSNDPWMFHQADTRNYDGAGHSLLSDLLDSAFKKYAAVMTLPIVSPTMDDLAARVKNRMALDASGVVATIAGSSLTVTVAHAATIPVTGLCVPGAESYAGQTISYLALSDGQTATYPLGSCAGAGASVGTGGASGNGGPAGTGPGGAAGTPSAGGAGGISGAPSSSSGSGGSSDPMAGAGGADGGGKQAGTSAAGSATGAASNETGPEPRGCACELAREPPGRGALSFALLSVVLIVRRRRVPT